MDRADPSGNEPSGEVYVQPQWRYGATCQFGRSDILGKLHAHDGAKLKDVLADVYRDAVPDPTDITKFEWQTILAYLGGGPA